MPEQSVLSDFTYTDPASGKRKWLSYSKHKQTTLLFLQQGLFSIILSYFNKDPL